MANQNMMDEIDQRLEYLQNLRHEIQAGRTVSVPDAASSTRASNEIRVVNQKMLIEKTAKSIKAKLIKGPLLAGFGVLLLIVGVPPIISILMVLFGTGMVVTAQFERWWQHD